MTTTTETITLPMVPSELLQLAIDDARRLDRINYIPDSSSWHRPLQKNPEICRVCLAGAVMAGTLKVSPDRSAAPDYVHEPGHYHALVALDVMRRGLWNEAFNQLGIVAALPEGLVTPRYTLFCTWEQFDVHLEDQQCNVEVLRAAGL